MSKGDITILGRRLKRVEEKLNILEARQDYHYHFEKMFFYLGYEHAWKATAAGNPTAFECAKCGATYTVTGPMAYIYSTSECKDGACE